MASAQFTITAQGFGHPPDIQPVQRHPGAAVEWHRADCPIAIASLQGVTPLAKCPLKTGCASAPKQEGM